MNNNEYVPDWLPTGDFKTHYFVSDCLDVDFNSEDSDGYDDSYYAAATTSRQRKPPSVPPRRFARY